MGSNTPLRQWLPASIRVFGASGSGFGVTGDSLGHASKVARVPKNIFTFTVRHGAIPVINGVSQFNQTELNSNSRNSGDSSFKQGAVPAKNETHPKQQEEHGNSRDSSFKQGAVLAKNKNHPKQQEEDGNCKYYKEAENSGDSSFKKGEVPAKNKNHPKQQEEHGNCKYNKEAEILGDLIPTNKTLNLNNEYSSIHPIPIDVASLELQTPDVQNTISQCLGQPFALEDNLEIENRIVLIEDASNIAETTLVPLQTFNNDQSFNEYLNTDSNIPTDIITFLDIHPYYQFPTTLNNDVEDQNIPPKTDVACGTLECQNGPVPSEFPPCYEYSESLSMSLCSELSSGFVCPGSPSGSSNGYVSQFELSPSELSLEDNLIFSKHPDEVHIENIEVGDTSSLEDLVIAKKSKVYPKKRRCARAVDFKTFEGLKAPKKSLKRESEDTYNRNRCKTYRDNKRRKLASSATELEIEEQRNMIMKSKEDDLKRKIAKLQETLLFAIKNNHFKCKK